MRCDLPASDDLILAPRFRHVLMILLASGSASWGAPAQDPPVVAGAPGDRATSHPQDVHWPGEGGRRIEVRLGIYVVDFARINLREESFDMAGYLDTSWTDPSLALAPGTPPRG